MTFSAPTLSDGGNDDLPPKIQRSRQSKAPIPPVGRYPGRIVRFGVPSLGVEFEGRDPQVCCLGTGMKSLVPDSEDEF